MSAPITVTTRSGSRTSSAPQAGPGATFVPVLLVTEGGPQGATTTPPLYLYRRAFEYGELGYASMLSVVLLRLIRGHFKPDQHFAFEGAAWYWHFVDVVWVGLYIVVYWL